MQVTDWPVKNEFSLQLDSINTEIKIEERTKEKKKIMIISCSRIPILLFSNERIEVAKEILVFTEVK